MAYVPIDPTALKLGLLGTSTTYQTIIGNHAECYENSEPPIFDIRFAESVPSNITDTLWLTWRLRGNQDLLPVKLAVYAESVDDTSVLTFRVGGESATANITAAGTYTLTVTPAVAGPVVCSLSVTVPALATLSIAQVQSRLSASSGPAAGLLPSGYTRVDSVGVYAANEPVSSEHVSRWLAGPVAVARSRPAAVATHIVRVVAPATAKSYRNWHAYNSTEYTLVGRLVIPRVSQRVRRYVLDAYTLESVGGGKAEVTIGGIEWSLPDLGGAAGKWHELELDLPPGPHDVRVAIQAGTGNAARMTTFQAWRARRLYA